MTLQLLMKLSTSDHTFYSSGEVTACFNYYPSPFNVLLCSLFFPFILVKVPSGEEKHSHCSACVLFAAVALLSCLVRAFSSPPDLSGALRLCHLSLTEQWCRSAAHPSASCRHVAFAGSPQAVAFPNASCGASRGIVLWALQHCPVSQTCSPHSTGVFRSPTRIAAPQCQPQVLLKASAAVVGVGGWNGIWWVATWSTARAVCVEWEDIRTWRKARRQRRERRYKASCGVEHEYFLLFLIEASFQLVFMWTWPVGVISFICSVAGSCASWWEQESWEPQERWELQDLWASARLEPWVLQ